jgi:hypothetical protein
MGHLNLESSRTKLQMLLALGLVGVGFLEVCGVDLERSWLICVGSIDLLLAAPTSWLCRRLAKLPKMYDILSISIIILCIDDTIAGGHHLRRNNPIQRTTPLSILRHFLRQEQQTPLHPHIRHFTTTALINPPHHRLQETQNLDVRPVAQQLLQEERHIPRLPHPLVQTQLALSYLLELLVAGLVDLVDESLAVVLHGSNVLVDEVFDFSLDLGAARF